MVKHSAEHTPEPDSRNAIIVSGDALQSLTPQELADIGDDIAWMLRARLGSSAVTITAAEELMPIDREKDDDTKARVARSMRELRIAAGFTQTGLAEAVGSTQAAVSDIENRGRLPRIDTVGRIADATGNRVGMYVARRTTDEDRVTALAAKLTRDRA